MNKQNETPNDIPNIWNDIAKRALRTGAHIPMVEEQFDREKALHGLAWNFGFNRRKKPQVVNNFAQIISDGSFAPGSMIRIARNESGEWVLVDGQHRLEAIVKANVNIWLVVVVDERLANIAYAGIDNVGTLRTGGDAVSSILGWTTKRWTNTIGAASIIASNFSRTYMTATYFTQVFSSANRRNELVADVMAKYKNEFLAFGKIATDAFFLRAPSLAVHIIASHYAPQIFWPYFNAALKDDMLAKNSPEKKLSELRNFPAVQRHERFRLLCYTVACWNAKFKGEELARLPNIFTDRDRATQVPKILGTPYPM